MSKLKGIIGTVIIVFVTGCASVPLPPHCDDTGEDMKPINSISGTKAQ